MTEKDRIAWVRQQAAVYRMLEESASALAANADMFDGMPADKKLAERIKGQCASSGWIV